MAAASLGTLTGNHRDHALVDTRLNARFTIRGSGQVSRNPFQGRPSTLH